MVNSGLVLRKGSKIAIIGGGPAGSFFAYFASRYAAEKGLDIKIKIFDRKSFCQRGPRGCNMCAGVISENLFNELESEGINISQHCVQRKIESYSLLTQDEYLLLRHPVPGHIPKIVTVFRGNGPVQSPHKGNVSFDDFLLNHVRKRGVEIVFEVVKELRLPSKKGELARVVYGEDDSRNDLEVDLVVGAFGVNTGMMEKVAHMGFGYKPPKTVRTCQCEIMLDRKYIEKVFGNKVFVFALGKKELKFASITPKADYVTVNLVGKTDLTRNNLIDFLSQPTVRKLMPDDWDIPKNFCMCISKIPVSYAKHPYTDRVVILGDASISRTYKSGIESAFGMARLSAQTAFKYGVSKEAFMNGYFRPAKRILAKDNLYGIVMLKINDWISTQREISNTHIKILKSSSDEKTANRINEILWNLFTGNATYKEIFYKAMNPPFLLKMLLINALAWLSQKKDEIGVWQRRN